MKFLVEVNCIFDTTFFKMTFGVMVFRINELNLPIKKQKYSNVLRKYVKTEKIIEYENCLLKLDSIYIGGYKSFTVDGRKGVVKLLETRYPSVPVQMCIFHQVQIVLRYITKNPKNECGKDLKKLILTLKSTTKQDFINQFNQLQAKHQGYLSEYKINPITSRKQFTHKPQRSAVRSINTHLRNLFTFQDYPELNIPPTTNSCDGSFGHWKAKVKLHRGISTPRKQEMIDEILGL